jgi:hypothetical protein
VPPARLVRTGTGTWRPGGEFLAGGELEAQDRHGLTFW